MSIKPVATLALSLLACVATANLARADLIAGQAGDAPMALKGSDDNPVAAQRQGGELDSFWSDVGGAFAKPFVDLGHQVSHGASNFAKDVQDYPGAVNDELHGRFRELSGQDQNQPSLPPNAGLQPRGSDGK
jgi:hypothetical protein